MVNRQGYHCCICSMSGRSVGNASTGIARSRPIDGDRCVQSFLDAKAMAKTLRQLLADRSWSISHSESLELVARQFGVPNWNVLAARIEQVRPSVPEPGLPKGWRPSHQTDEGLFRLGIDTAVPGAALIESRFVRDSGVELREHCATCMQSISAKSYRTQRLQLTAELRTEDADRGSIWMRVDNGAGQAASFDNMFDRQKAGVLEGTIGWTQRSIVLQVGEEATTIHFGFLLKGYGRLWARNFKLDTVESNIPLTAAWSSLETTPQNLNFAQ